MRDAAVAATAAAAVGNCTCPVDIFATVAAAVAFAIGQPGLGVCSFFRRLLTEGMKGVRKHKTVNGTP